MKFRWFKRLHVQLLFTLATNSYLKGFFTGRIYRGGAKHICVPGLNCYSCPGALFSCPIGAIQTTLAGFGQRVSLYVVGFLTMAATLTGRLTCGWLCPFGLIQESLYRIPVRKFSHTKTASGTPVPKTRLRLLKYLILILFVFLLPALIRSDVGLGTTWFCAYVCPAGTVEAALPLLLSAEGLREILGWQFIWKAVIAAGFIVLSLFENRPFCKFACPLGAAYSLGNRIAVFRLEVESSTCISCGKCQTSCPMGLDPVSELSSPECIRCGTCKGVCPVSAITWTNSLRAVRAPSAPGDDL